MERATEASDAVLSIFEDHAGDLWVGTETDGVRVLRDRAFQLLDPLRQSPDVSPTSVIQSADGNIWVGTSGAGVFLTNQTSRGKDTLAANRELSTETVLAMASGGKSPTDLWVGTSSGLNLLHQGRWKNFTSADGLADDFIRSLLPSRDGSLWIGTQHGLSNLHDGHVKTFTTAQGLGSNLIGPMLEVPNGDLWIGTFGGLSRLHAGVFRNFTVADGLPGNTVTALAVSANGAMWVGTRGQGLARWDGSRFMNFLKVRSIPSEIYALIDDGVGSLWMTSEHGIFRVSIRDLEAVSAGSTGEVPVISYGSADGVPSVDTTAIGYPSAWRLSDGRLCFVTRRGVVVVDPALTRRDEQPPPVVLEEIAIDDRIVTPEQMASLAPGPLHFSFSFVGIDLSAPQRVQYRYMLEGLDRDWVYAGTRRVAYYTSIPHGHYRFRVSARNELGVWSEPAQLSFELRPHLYQTLWLRALLGLLLLAIGVGIYAVRVRRLRSRFDMVSAERNRLAREIHDTLAQSFVAVSMRLEIMSQMLRKSSAERPDVLPDRLTEQLDQTRGLVRDSIEEARRSIWDLRSEGAGAQSLPARLARVVQEATARGQLARMETTGTFRPLEQRLEDELYRIAQEAVNNAIRHARAQSIRLRLAYELESLSLEVRDDGQGFDPDAVPSRQSGHYGLTGIRERASLIGAEVMLGSVIGKGTTVRVTLPLTQGKKHAKRRTL
jgi:signal transduction histidine kinase